jgi:hydrogen peroxide-dependent heme synthase
MAQDLPIRASPQAVVSVGTMDTPVIEASASPVTPAAGWVFTHLFVQSTALVDAEAVHAAVKALRAADHHVLGAAILGHKADACFLAYGPDTRALRRFQSSLQAAGLALVDSFVSITEVNEYATHLDDSAKQGRLYPTVPTDKRAWCFYPMSKRRGEQHNWFEQEFDERSRMMRGHGMSGRNFAGRITQMITASTGLDDWEWGVTLFGNHIDDLKDVVYTMRYDEASARYGEFGPFYVGYLTDDADLVALLTPFEN